MVIIRSNYKRFLMSTLNLCFYRRKKQIYILTTVSDIEHLFGDLAKLLSQLVSHYAHMPIQYFMAEK